VAIDSLFPGCPFSAPPSNIPTPNTPHRNVLNTFNFASNQGFGINNLFQKAAGGSGQDEPLLRNTVPDVPSQWSRDGRFIVYQEDDPKNKHDLWVVPIEAATGDRKPIPFLRTEFDELLGQLSPDNH